MVSGFRPTMQLVDYQNHDLKKVEINSCSALPLPKKVGSNAIYQTKKCPGSVCKLWVVYEEHLYPC